MLGWYLGEECAQQSDHLLQKDLSKDCEEYTVPGQGAAACRSGAREHSARICGQKGNRGPEDSAPEGDLDIILR